MMFIIVMCKYFNEGRHFNVIIYRYLFNKYLDLMAEGSARRRPKMAAPAPVHSFIFFILLIINPYIKDFLNLVIVSIEGLF